LKPNFVFFKFSQAIFRSCLAVGEVIPNFEVCSGRSQIFENRVIKSSLFDPTITSLKSQLLTTKNRNNITKQPVNTAMRLRGHQFLLFSGLLTPASGFGIPSPIDIHSAATALASLHEQSIHLFHNDASHLNEAVVDPMAIQIKDHFTNDIRELYTAVKQATVTKRVDNALAGVLAEAAAGATGALISRKTSVTMIGGTKRDSLETKMKTTGAFFGARLGAEGKFFFE
jgi:hypothetical protein